MAESNEANEEQSLIETQPLNVFLTDGTNPVARVLLRSLTVAGHQVTAMTADSTGAAQIRADGGLPVFADPTRVGEIRGMLQMSKAQIVIHTAPQNANQPPFSAPDYSVSALENETKAVVQAAREAEVAYLIHLSFAFLYGDTGGQAATESTALSNAETPLIRAGKAAEKAVKAGDLPYAIIRAGYVYSADSEVLRSVDAALKATRPVHTGSADKLATWITADDLADLVVRVVNHRPAEAVFNAVDDAPASPKAFVDYLIESQGVGTSNPFTSLLRALIPNRTAQLLEISTQASNATAKETLGWSPRFKTYKDGISDILMTWRAQFKAKA